MVNVEQNGYQKWKKYDEISKVANFETAVAKREIYHKTLTRKGRL